MSKIVYNYEHLADAFASFWHAKRTAYWLQQSQYLSPESSESLVFASSRLNLSREEYLERFVMPFDGLNKLELGQVLQALSSFSVRFFGEPLEFKVSTPLDESQKALYWLFIQVLDLNIPKLNPILKANPFIAMECSMYGVKEPVHQCLNCGKIDPKTSKYCHKPNCPRTISKHYDGPDPSGHGKHEEGCCFREFGQAKKTLKNALNRVAASPSLSEREKKREISKLFMEFCKRRYERNKLIIETINTVPVREA